MILRKILAMLLRSFTVLVILNGCSNCIEKNILVKDKVNGSKNYEAGKFINLEKDMQKSFISGFLKVFTNKNKTKPDNQIKIINKKFDKNKFSKREGLKITWVGHSTVLINIDGVNILTDPIWSESASPMGIGLKRYNSPAIKFEDLPKIDIVLISHDHYDHLDKKTIKRIYSKNKEVEFITALGVGVYINRWGVPKRNIKHFDWWEEYKFKDKLMIVCTPARHNSGRGMFSRNKTLWSSWVIKSDVSNIYFGGDSGYGKHFKAIGDKYGPFDIAMLEMGAYDDNWPDMHMNPKVALKAYKDLKGKKVMPLHWGTFQLGFHTWDEPANDLFKNGNNDELFLPMPGKVYNNNFSETKKWWIDKK